jgi:hypothetical protein
MTDTEAELLKIVRATLVTGEARLFDHLFTTFRWLLATLFAANGGAIIGLLGWKDASNHGGYTALGWFAVGLVLSILMGVVSTIGAVRGIVAIERSRLSIDQSLLTRVVPDKQVFDDLIARNKPTWKTWTAAYVGGASLLCLIVGMLVIASHL